MTEDLDKFNNIIEGLSNLIDEIDNKIQKKLH